MRKPRMTERRLRGMGTIIAATDADLTADNYIAQGLSRKEHEEAESALKYLRDLHTYYDRWFYGPRCNRCESSNVSVEEVRGYDHKYETYVGVTSYVCKSCKYEWSD